mgnify:FL=1|jgi:hypothetical protein
MVWRDDDSIRFYQDTPDKRGVSELMINNVWGGSLYDNIRECGKRSHSTIRV